MEIVKFLKSTNNLLSKNFDFLNGCIIKIIYMYLGFKKYKNKIKIQW